MAILSMSSANAERQMRISVCAADSNYYPYIYHVDNHPYGIYNKMLKAVGRDSGNKFRLYLMDWNQCVAEVKSGRIDGILGVPFTGEYSEFLDFPGNAGNTSKSDLFLNQVPYVVVNSSSSEYIFNGDKTKLPAPRIYQIGHKPVSYDKSDFGYKNIEQVLLNISQNKAKTAVVMKTVAESFINKSNYVEKFKIHDTPYSSVQFFLAFSKLGENVNKNKREDIWASVKSVRYDLMAQLLMENSHGHKISTYY